MGTGNSLRNSGLLHITRCMSIIVLECVIWIYIILILTQGKTHKLKPGVKEPVGGVAKGAPAAPLEDLSLRIYLCEGLLGRPSHLFNPNSSSYMFFSALFKKYIYFLIMASLEILPFCFTALFFYSFKIASLFITWH